MLLEGRTCWWYQLDVVARQETEQLCLVVIDSEEAGPVAGDGCTAHHSSSKPFPSLGPCRALEGVWQVAVPH